MDETEKVFAFDRLDVGGGIFSEGEADGFAPAATLAVEGVAGGGVGHPPSSMEMSALSYGDATNCVLFGTEWFADFRSKYGHLILVFQELEQELKSTVDYMQLSCERRGIDEEFESEPKNSTFEKLIRMFASQLDQSGGSRDLVSRLHQARKYRNRLAHDFTSAESLADHLSAGGRAKTIGQLDARIRHVIPLVMIVHRIGRAYASDVGVTDQFMDKEIDRIFEELGLNEDQMLTYMTGKVIKEDGAGSAADLSEL